MQAFAAAGLRLALLEVDGSVGHRVGGGTRPRTGDRQCRYAPPRDAPAPCVADVTVDKVVRAALALLRESPIDPS
jgi:hypothetical protein